MDKKQVTVILTVWKRNNLEEQLNALALQTHLPYDIWVYQCGNHVNIDHIKFEYPHIHYINSSINLGYYGRFSLAKHISSEYVWVLDDDVIPSPIWIETCIYKCSLFNSVITSAGRVIPINDYTPELLKNVDKYFYGDVKSDTSYNYCTVDTLVDFGCNSWFFKSDWIKAFWELYPYTFHTGEDIHLSASLKIILGVHTLVAEQKDYSSSGNQKKAYGYDQFSSWNKPDFLIQRENIFRHLIVKEKWKPLLWVSDS